jgi:uncharacterized repeat protein (TIGR01451 family)
MTGRKRRYPGRVTTYLHTHRAIRRPESRGKLIPMMGAGLIVAALWILYLPLSGAIWVWVLDLVREPLGMAESTTALHYVIGDRLVLVLPKLVVAAAVPTAGHLWASGLLCVLTFGVSYLLPVKWAPTNYFLRALALIQGTAVAFFAIQPWPFPYTAGDYVTGLTGAGLGLIAIVPLILAATHWLLDFSWLQKVNITLVCMGYLFVMIPVKYALHAVALYWGGLLYMPVLFILFGLPMEVFSFIALFSWGMSWESRAPRSRSRVRTAPRSTATMLTLTAFLLMGASSIGAPGRADIDLAISSSLDNATPPVATSISFTIVVTEESGHAASAVIIDATLASGLAYVSAQATQGSYDPGSGEWTVGDLSASGTATLTLTARADSFDPIGQSFEVKSHDQNDTDSTPGNGSTSEDDDDSQTVTPTAIGGEICYVVADSGDTLLRVTRNGNAEQTIGPTGALTIEATAYWPGTETVYAADGGRFGTLDTSTGAFSFIGSFGTASGSEGNILLSDADGLAFDPMTGVLWASHRREGFQNLDDLLFQVNTSTGSFIPDAFGAGADYVVIAANVVTGLGDIDDLAIDAVDGTLFAINNIMGSDWLVTIDKTDGSVTVIGTLGQDDMEGLAFDAYGNLYGSTGISAGVNNNSFLTVNKTTGVASLVTNLFEGADHESVACLVDGVNDVTGGVYFDVDANGTWDSGTDTGASGITVELYRDANSDGLVDGGDALVATDETDGSGNYSFQVAAEGDFVMQIDTADLPADATMTTDNVEVASFTGFGNTDANNRFLYKRPIDLSLTMVVDEPSPDVGNNVVFTITLVNAGPVDATTVQVTNTLPGTLSFVSSVPSQGTFDSATGVWTVGTMLVSGSATLAIKATIDTEDPATNWAEVTAADQTDVDSTPDNNQPAEDDQDDATVTPVGGSGGGGGGLESNGTLAGKLARLLFDRRMTSATTGVSVLPRFQYDLVPPAGKTASSALLRSIIPASGPAQSVPYETSPEDLLPVTNASEVVAADFLRDQDQRRIGAVFATMTRSGALYEHTKVVCDRLQGAELVSVREVAAAGQPFLMSRLIHEGGAIDYSISYVAYRVGGAFVVDSRFRLDEYRVPANAGDVLNVQLWSVSREYTKELLEASLAQLGASGPISFLNDASNPPRLPGVYVRTGSYANGRLQLSLYNRSEASQIRITGGTLQRTELGDRTSFEQTLALPPPDDRGVSTVELSTGPLFDASFFIETDSGDRDVVYLADGAWSYTYDTDGSDVTGFDVAVDEFAPKAGTHKVERAVSMQGEVQTWAVLFRYLRANGRPLDLSRYNYVEFTASGRGQMRVLFEKESVRTSDHYGTVIKLRPEPVKHRLWFDDIRLADGTGKLVADDLLLISFYMIGEQGRATAFDLNVGDLRFGGGEGDPVAVTPDEYELKQNFPNPFNPTTQIGFGMPEDGPVRLEVFDTLGRSVGVLADGFVSAGRHTMTFDASRLSSGVYLYRLQTPNRTLVRYMTLLR